MDIYNKNLEALRINHQDLVGFIENTKVSSEKIVTSNSVSEGLKIQYRQKNRSDVVMTDEVDPNILPSKAKDLLESEESKVLLLLGFGTGSYPELLKERLGERGFLVVFEAMPDVFKAVMQCRDISHLLASDQFELILGGDCEKYLFLRRHHKDIARGRFYVLKQRESVALNERVYDEFRQKIVDEKRLADTDVLTSISRGAEWNDAFIENIPSILRTPGVKKLRGLFKDKPAIIVSAGPSVEKNVHLLHEAKGRAIIIAVDVMVPTLIPAGILPDFIVVLEANKKQFQIFQNNPMLRYVPLICSAEVSKAITSLYPGPLFLSLLPHGSVNAWLRSYWESKEYIAGFGGSVSHTAFALAELLGANPIAIIGQDLSFEKKLHAGDVTGLFYGDDEIEGYKKRNPVVEDIFGKKCHTMPQFLTYRTSFENRIKNCTAEIINATEGGLPIKGAQNLKLKDFLDEYCGLQLVNTFEVLDSLSKETTEYDLNGVLSEVELGSKKLSEIHKNVKRIVDSVTRLQELKTKNLLQTGEAAQIILTIEKLEKNIEGPMTNLVASYRYRVENYFRRTELNDPDLDLIQDSLSYYGILGEAIERFLKKINGLITALTYERDVDLILSDESVLAVEKFFYAGMIHAKAGMVRQAVQELERSATEFSLISDPVVQKKYWPLILESFSVLAESYFKQHRFYEAIEILQVLEGLVGKEEFGSQPGTLDQQAIRNLTKACRGKIVAWEQKKSKMSVLVEKAKSAYGSHLEAGSFYFKIGDYASAERAYLKSIDEEQTLVARNADYPDIFATHEIRLISSFYGLAQIYKIIKRHDDALLALNSGKEEIEKLTSFELSEALEGFGELFIDLYRNMGEKEKALSLYQHLQAILPTNHDFGENIRTFMDNCEERVLEAHQ